MDGDLDAQFVSQFLQFELPQPHARTVAAATIGGDRQAAHTGIALGADRLPPAADL